VTGGEFTAAAVGSYEREFRSATVERLAVLCGHYGVPLVEVLTGRPAPPGCRSAPATAAAGTAQEIRALRQFAASLTHRRTGPSLQAAVTGMPRLRYGNFEVLAVVLDTSPARLRQLAAQNLVPVPTIAIRTLRGPDQASPRRPVSRLCGTSIASQIDRAAGCLGTTSRNVDRW